MTPGQKAVIGLKIVASKTTGRPRPFFVQYSLLNACNARCAYCNSPARDATQLTTGDHRRVLGELARLGSVRIKFLGGEPLLRPDIGELVAETRRLHMRAAMVTNGFLVIDKFDVVRQLDELIISIDGREAPHDRQRGRGTWSRVMAAIEACADAKLDFFLSAVVTRNSMGEVDWLIDTARRLGVMVNFQIPQFNPEVYGAQASALMPGADDIRAILRKVIAEKERGAPVLFTTRSYRRTLAWEDYGVERVDRPGEPSPCTAGKYFLQIEPNGDVYPCVLHIGSFRPKNVLADGVEAAWRHAMSHSCGGCYNTWLNENRGVFDLHPTVIGNFWNNYLSPRRSRRAPPQPAE
jgi:MoaA/NifB/PqqE/SkfB family radical SAM enzyme